MAHDVFISHSTKDKTISDAVCAALEGAGVRCWIAPRDVQPGRSFAGEINRAIQHSKVMVLIFSAHSNNSEQVLREVQLAVNSHLHIIQFRIEDVRLNDDLEYFLSTPHWLDALTPPLENHVERLATSIKALLGTPVESSVTASASTKPQTTTYSRQFWRSTAAVVLGLFVYVVLFLGIYRILQTYDTSEFLVSNFLERFYLFVVVDHFVSAVAAGYTAARLAPRNPMRHVWIVAFIWLSLVIGKAGLLYSKSVHLRAIEFRIFLTCLLISLPCFWLGGVLHRRFGIPRSLRGSG